jgi:penicillin-binding protein 1A
LIPVRTLGTLVRLLATLLLAGLVAGMTALLATPQVVDVATSGEWEHDPVALASTGRRSLVYDRNGELMATFFEQNRTPISLEQIPLEVRQAILAIEDEDFYAHQGVNIKATGRALVENVDAGGISQGGSTITQQLIKNLVLTDEQTVERKIQEASLAVRLEDQLTKDEILELYLNTVFFGETASGVQAAAEVYFGLDLVNKTPEQVTQVLDGALGWPEAALLASLIRSPSANNPIVHPETAAYQRGIVLNRLADLEMITEEEARVYAQAPLPTQRHQPTLPSEDDFYVAEVRRLLLDDPRYLGGGPESRLADILGVSGGLRITTAFDPRVQTMAEDARDKILRQDNNVDPMFTMAIASVEPDTGAVRAMVGGENFDEDSKFNLATQGERQPGSSFKTFVLVAALRAGFQTNDTINGRGPCEWPDPNEPGGLYTANNYGGSSGKLAPIFSQLLASSNCAFLKLGLLTGFDNIIETAHLLGITTELEPVRAMPLGTEEVIPLEMAKAYATIASGGLRREPYFIETVERQVGSRWVTVYDRTDDPYFLPTRVIDEDIACWATAALDANVPNGTGGRAQLPNSPAAGKTGTTEDWSDAWFVGFTPHLATAVWMGFPDDRVSMIDVGGLRRVTGGSFPAQVWGVFNTAYHEGLPVRAFPRCPGFPRAPKTLRTDIDPVPQAAPCPDTSPFLVDLNAEEVDFNCFGELPAGFVLCTEYKRKYELEIWDLKNKPIPIYCGDFPEPDEGDPPPGV